MKRSKFAFELLMPGGFSLKIANVQEFLCGPVYTRLKVKRVAVEEVGVKRVVGVERIERG